MKNSFSIFSLTAVLRCAVIIQLLGRVRGQSTQATVTCKECQLHTPDPVSGERYVLCIPYRVPDGDIGGDVHGQERGDPCYEECRYAGGGETAANDEGSMLEPQPINVVNNVGGNSDHYIPSYEEMMAECVECQKNRIAVCATSCPGGEAISDCTSEIEGEDSAPAARFRFVQSGHSSRFQGPLVPEHAVSKKKLRCPSECKHTCAGYCPNPKQCCS